MIWYVKEDRFTSKEPKNYEICILHVISNVNICHLDRMAKRLHEGQNSYVSTLVMLIDVDDRYDILIRISAVHRLVYDHHMLSHA